MSEVIYVIVSKEDGSVVKGSGPRKIMAYTTEGRAKAAFGTHRLNSGMYEIKPFIMKEDE